MFTIDATSLEQTIADLEKAKQEIESGHQSAVLKPALYLPALESVVLRVLTGLATEAELPAVETMARGIVSWVRGNNMAFELLGVSGGFEGLEDAKPGDFGFERLKGLEGDIEDWVREKKRKDQVDRERYPDDAKLAQHIIGTIKNDPNAWLASQDPNGLIAFLRERNPEMFERIFGLTSLSGARLDELLGAVLEAWGEVILPHLEAASLEFIDRALS